MLFNELKIDLFSKNDKDFEETNLINNIIELMITFSLEIMPAFKLKNEDPQHLFDNIIGKYAAYLLLMQGIKVKNFEYNSYWLENDNFIKLITDKKIIFNEVETVHVEYWFKNNIETLNNQYHKDIYDNNVPMFTSLIYLNDNMIPTLIFDKNDITIRKN